MTTGLFRVLDVYHDTTPRSAAMNMATDEALLENASSPSIRFYRWDHPALSFGYFGKFNDVSEHRHQRDIVRRWTGGGIVFHGEDLTYSIIIPASAELFDASSRFIYAAVHSALRDALVANDQYAELAAVATVSDRRNTSVPVVGDRRYNREACFANPAAGDVLINGRKVAGAAQRRTRRGLLQQGSIQNVDLGNGLADKFATELCEARSQKSLNKVLIRRAREIAQQKYGTTSWLQRR